MLNEKQTINKRKFKIDQPHSILDQEARLRYKSQPGN